MLNPTGEGPELVALALLERIAHSGRRQFDRKPEDGMTVADHRWILDTCFEGHRPATGAAKDPTL